MPDTPAVQPALTEKEWREQIAHEVSFSRTSGHGEIAGHVYATLADVTDGGPEANGETEAVEIHWGTVERSAQLWDRHKLAALCLYNQAFGFTHEDVDLVLRCVLVADFDSSEAPEDMASRASLARRISALLPPTP